MGMDCPSSVSQILKIYFKVKPVPIIVFFPVVLFRFEIAGL